MSRVFGSRPEAVESYCELGRERENMPKYFAVLRREICSRQGRVSEEGDGVVTYSEPTESKL